VIQVERLTKVYRVPEKRPGLRGALGSLFHRTWREVRAVDDISFAIRPGERVGFLGPNGAGKTTTLKMLSGLLVPSDGAVQVLGHVPRKRPVDLLRRITLVMGQKQQLLWDLPPRDTFELNRALYDVPPAQFRQTLDELVELLALTPLLDRPVRNLSLGERMKCELAAALLHRPEVLFLDEPTIGLDVVMQVQVRRFIQQWNERHGATVLLTSHYMDDVAALCPRVIVIDGGRIRFDGALGDLVRRHRPLRRVRLKPSTPILETPPAHGLQRAGDAWVGDVPADRVGQLVTEALARMPDAELTIEEPPLEEVFAEFFTTAREAQ
jgi:ABC-2 type transport system ATP-binding protein